MNWRESTMNKTFLIFGHEFRHAVFSLGFIFLTFTVPILGLLAIGGTKWVTTLVTPSEQLLDAVGFVDQAGIIAEPTSDAFDRLVRFSSQQDATQALLREVVSEFVVITADHLSTGTLRRYTLEREFDTPATTVFMLKSFLTVNLLQDDVAPEIVTSVVSPLDLQVTRLDENGQPALEQSNIGNVIIPAVFSLLLGLALTFGANSLLSGFGEEKESRLIEVLFSSVSVGQLLVGKILALGTAGLLQVLVWLISAPLLLHLASSTFGGFMSEIQIPANFLVLGILYFILGYLLFAVFSICVGAITSNAMEGSQLAMFYLLTCFVPLWFSSLMFAFPKSSVWTALMIFPITAPVQAMLRLGVSDIPLWEILTSIGVLVFSVVAGLFLSVRIFRVYMLTYGTRPGVSEIIQSLKST